MISITFLTEKKAKTKLHLSVNACYTKLFFFFFLSANPTSMSLKATPWVHLSLTINAEHTLWS